MDVKKYIESGILEAYVNGLLSEEESREVDRMAEKYQQVKLEIQEIIQVLDAYSKVAPGPKPQPLEAILSAFEKEKKTVTHPELVQRDDMANVEDEPKKATGMWYLAAAALVLLVISVGINMYLLAENSKLSEKISLLSSRNDYLAQQYKATFQSPQSIEFTDSILNNNGLQSVELTKVGEMPESKVMVYWHPENNTVYIYPHQLPGIPEGSQYQLWAIVNGVSIDAGVFNNDATLQELRKVQGPIDAFAVTLEQKGGNPIPTLEEMYALGEIKG